MRTGRGGSGRPVRHRVASWAVVSGVQPYAVTIAICSAKASGVTESARVAAAGERVTAWYIRIGTGWSSGPSPGRPPPRRAHAPPSPAGPRRRAGTG